MNVYPPMPTSAFFLWNFCSVPSPLGRGLGRGIRDVLYNWCFPPPNLLPKGGGTRQKTFYQTRNITKCNRIAIVVRRNPLLRCK
jgi:hypothetical protein